MRRKIMFLFFVPLVIALSSCQNQSIKAGRYVNQNRSVIELHKNGLYHLKRISNGERSGISPSGVSNGTYTFKNGVLILTSEKSLQKNGQAHLDLHVKNQIVEENQYLSFNFTNLPHAFSSLDPDHLEIRIEIFVNDEYVQTESISVKSDSIKLPIEVDEGSIVSFSISVFFFDCIKNGPYDLGCFYLHEYAHDDFGSNYFEIDFPQLGLNDFYYLYFDKVHIPVENDKIFWNGDVYALEK